MVRQEVALPFTHRAVCARYDRLQVARPADCTFLIRRMASHIHRRTFDGNRLRGDLHYTVLAINAC